jgi:hypothetical protein
MQPTLRCWHLISWSFRCPFGLHPPIVDAWIMASFGALFTERVARTLDIGMGKLLSAPKREPVAPWKISP